MSAALQWALEMLSAVRPHLTNHPLLLWALCLGAVSLPLIGRAASALASSSRALSAAAVGVVVAYAVLVLWYLQLPQYADAAEPTIAAVAWLYERGQPIYHAVAAPERYSHIYGPLAFIVPAWTMHVLGPALWTSKAAGAIAGSLSIIVTFGICRAFVAGARALALCGLFALTCLAFQHASFWNRPDSLELLFASVALFSVIRFSSPMVSTLALGVTTAVLVDLKMTGPLYAIPAFCILLSRGQVIQACVAGAVALAGAAAPFLALRNVSFDNYIAWMRMSAGNGIELLLLRQNAEWALALAVPLMIGIRFSHEPEHRGLLIGACAGMVGVIIAAAKPGAGPYHLLPFAPAIVCGAAMRMSRSSRPPYLSTMALTIAMVLLASVQAANVLQSGSRTAGLPLADDLRRIVSRNPSTSIAMGYSSENEAFPYVRPLLVFAGNDYLLDAPAVQEFQLSGLALPAATVAAIERCAFAIWLMPRGGEPFSLRNRYPATGHAPLFDEAFRAAFHNTYERIESTEYFDLWRCRSARLP